MRIALFLLLSLGLAFTVNAEEKSLFSWDFSAKIVADYVAPNLAFKLGDGVHFQPAVTVRHDSGLYFGGFASTDGYVGGEFNGGADGFRWEIDVNGGYSGSIADGKITYDFNYAEFHIGVTEGKIVVPAATVSVNWNRDSFSPYLVVQAYLDEDVGPGREIAHRIGMPFGQYAVEFGGHSGAFGNDPAPVSFGRLKYTSQPLDWLFDSLLTVQMQLAFEEPAETRLFAGFSRQFGKR